LKSERKTARRKADSRFEDSVFILNEDQTSGGREWLSAGEDVSNVIGMSFKQVVIGGPDSPRLGESQIRMFFDEVTGHATRLQF
jgi:hypothetical protein